MEVSLSLPEVVGAGFYGAPATKGLRETHKKRRYLKDSALRPNDGRWKPKTPH
jgi:hypothetical protein